MIIRCLHCGAEIGNDNYEEEATSGLCDVCWKIYQDKKWYKAEGMVEISHVLEMILDSRRKFSEKEIREKSKKAQDYLDFWHARFIQTM